MINQTLKKLANMVSKRGGRLFIVGGAVRDKIMGRDPSDIDLVATGLDIETASEIFGIRIAGTDAPVFLVDDFEIALARTEKANGKKFNDFEFFTSPEVTIEQDLMRRDFTINAMAIDLLTDELIDPFGGQSDIENGILRHISDAFREDTIRVLRAFRFHARFGFKIASETKELINKMMPDLAIQTPERIFIEIMKAAKTDRFHIFVSDLIKFNAFEIIFDLPRSPLDTPPGPEGTHEDENDMHDHIVNVVKTVEMITSDPATKIAAMTHDNGKMFTDPDILPRHIGHDDDKHAQHLFNVLRKMGAPNAIAIPAMLTLRHHMRAARVNEMKPAKILKLAKELEKKSAFKALIAVVMADAGVDITDVLTVAMAVNKLNPHLTPKQKKAKNVADIVLQNRIENFKEIMAG